MSTLISQRLVEMRNERKLSQKDAATALGVSQALLSHYEKGIRECGLDFLCRASAFYDVSSDYLLGISDTKFMSDALFTAHNIPQDSEIRTSTIFRASIFLTEKMNKSGKSYSDKVRTIYILTLYQIYASAVNQGIIPPSSVKQDNHLSFLSSGIIDYMISEIYKSHPENKLKRNEKLPLCVETIIKEATRLVENEINKTLKNSNKS